MQAAKSLLAIAIAQTWTGNDLGLVRLLAIACVEQGLVADGSRAGFSFSLLAVGCCKLGAAASKHPLYQGGLERLLCQHPYSLFFALGSKVDNGRAVPAPAMLQLPVAVHESSAEVQAVLDVTWWDGRPPVRQPSSGGLAEKVRCSQHHHFRTAPQIGASALWIGTALLSWWSLVCSPNATHSTRQSSASTLRGAPAQQTRDASLRMALLSCEELRSLQVLSAVAYTLQAVNCCIMLQAIGEVSNSIQEQPAEAPESPQRVPSELTRVSAERVSRSGPVLGIQQLLLFISTDQMWWPR